jgi:hypothetical protein
MHVRAKHRAQPQLVEGRRPDLAGDCVETSPDVRDHLERVREVLGRAWMIRRQCVHGQPKSCQLLSEMFAQITRNPPTLIFLGRDDSSKLPGPRPIEPCTFCPFCVQLRRHRTKLLGQLGGALG